MLLPFNFALDTIADCAGVQSEKPGQDNLGNPSMDRNFGLTTCVLSTSCVIQLRDREKMILTSPTVFLP